MSLYIGHVASAVYGIENTFKTAPATVNRKFGIGAKVTTARTDWNWLAVHNLGSRLLADYVPRGFEGRMTAEWILSEPTFWAIILDESSGTINGGGTTYNVKNYSVPTLPPSITVDIVRGSNKRRILGAVAERMTLRIGERSEITVSSDFVYADHSIVSGASPADMSISWEPKTFADVTMLIDGSIPSELKITEAELTLTNNPELVFTIGSNKATTYYAREFVIEGRFKALVTGDTSLQWALNPDTTHDITLKIGDYDSYELGSMKVEITDAFISSVDENVEPTREVARTFEFRAKAISVQSIISVA